MDPFTLLSIGSGLLRLTGSAFGGNTATTTDKIANIVDQVQGLPKAAAEARMSAVLNGLTPDEIAELQRVGTRALEIKAEVEKSKLAAETAQQAQGQETARVEVQSSDEYVRRTRPRLARHSAYAAFAYAVCTAVAFPLIQFITGLFYPEAKVPELPTVQEWMVIALFTPCAAYMGVRTADAFSRSGKT